MSGGLDIKKLREVQKDINKKAGKGDSIFLFSNKLPEEMDIRILPPPDIANGFYYIEQEGWWIDGKFYVSNSTDFLKGEDVIEQEIEDAKASKDPELIALVDKKKGNMPVLKKEYRYLIPVLILDVNEDDESDFKVVDYKVLVAKPTLLKSINSVVTARPFQNGTKFGVADREKGYNLIIGKTGKGLDTEYSAMGWNNPSEIDEKWYDEKKMPNVFEMTEKVSKPDDYLRSVIRNYLYGEAIIELPKEDDKEAQKPTTSARKASARGNTTSRAATSEKDEDQPKSGRASSSRTSKETTKNSGRSILDDVESNVEDDDDLGDLD